MKKFIFCGLTTLVCLAILLLLWWVPSEADPLYTVVVLTVGTFLNYK